MPSFPITHCVIELPQRSEHAFNLEVNLDANSLPQNPFTSTTQAAWTERLISSLQRITSDDQLARSLPVCLLNDTMPNPGIGIQFLEVKIPCQFQLSFLFSFEVTKRTFDQITDQQSDQDLSFVI